MAKASKLVRDGESIPFRVGDVLIDVLCVRLALAYRVRICYGSTGAETDLSKPFPTEDEARAYARRWARVFKKGVGVSDILDILAAA